MKFKEYKKDDAPLMVFLHGGGVSGWMWDEQVKYFSSRYHCLVPDLPGHGLSKDEVQFSIKESAESIIKLIMERRTEKPIIIIGFSIGAQILIKILSLQPNLIDHAIINSALTKPLIFGRSLIAPLLKISYPLIRIRSFSKLQAKVLYIDNYKFNLYYQESIEMKLSTLTQIMEENMSFQLPKNFSEVKTKLLITVGEKEKKIMRKSAVEITKHNTNSTGIIIPKVGHGISLADPNYFNKMIENWINEGKLPNNAKPIVI